jgi:rod shape-determining protein MreC
MASPPNRRPGFSRRARLGLFAAYVAAITGVIAGIGLILVARADPIGYAVLRAGMTDLTAPITGAGRAVVRGVGSAGEAIAAYWNAGSQNRALRTELERARARLTEARAIEFENARLRRLLRIGDAGQTRIATVRVIGSTASSTRRLATITAGADAGVRPGQPVRAAEGLVGRVADTGRISARIILITDSGSTVPVRLIRNGIPALATGKGDGTLDLRALIAGETPFRVRDLVLTSGTGGVYPPNIPVAVVTQVSGDTAIAIPLADPARLDFAEVLDMFRPDLPPPPAPARAGVP